MVQLPKLQGEAADSLHVPEASQMVPPTQAGTYILWLLPGKIGWEGLPADESQVWTNGKKNVELREAGSWMTSLQFNLENTVLQR